MIMLIGIVEKNAVMQIDFALEAERSGKSPQEAIYQGCLIRFRPIMMTTMAAMLAAVPIAVGYGAGGEARQPLGLVVVRGLLFSQLVTLYLTPVVFIYMEQLQTWANGRRTVAQPLSDGWRDSSARRRFSPRCTIRTSPRSMASSGPGPRSRS